MSALRFEGVTATFPRAGRPALDDVSVDIAEGEFVVVAGASASGKSTFLGAACGLVPHFHGGDFAGRVVVSGLDTRDHGPAELGRVVGVVRQDPETQAVLTSVRAELAFGLENRGHGPAATARGVEEVALALGIEGLLDRAVHELSGGELQRVALGAALAGRPRIVLLDEPTSQLDPVAGDELVWLLRRLNEEWGTTVVLAEHRLERCLGAADRVLAFADGRLACDASPRAFLDWAGTAAPLLSTPGARLLAAAGLPAPAGVKEARCALRGAGLLDEATEPPTVESTPPRRRRFRRSGAGPEAALELRGVWAEHDGGRAVLRGIDLRVGPHERVALMGRNGAGKSTLLRHAAGLEAPTRGKVDTAGRVALLLQHPGDYLLHERVGDEVSAAALAGAGLGALADRHPRDLSGGERQRLAMTIVTGDGPPPAVLCLDEPTRGLDRAQKAELAHCLRAGAPAIVVATHDPEFAAQVADRVVLIADGAIVADAPASEVLSGGWYFATETARILGGAGGALLPEEGAALLAARAQSTSEVPVR